MNGEVSIRGGASRTNVWHLVRMFRTGRCPLPWRGTAVTASIEARRSWRSRSSPNAADSPASRSVWPTASGLALSREAPSACHGGGVLAFTAGPRVPTAGRRPGSTGTAGASDSLESQASTAASRFRRMARGWPCISMKPRRRGERKHLDNRRSELERRAEAPRPNTATRPPIRDTVVSFSRVGSRARLDSAEQRGRASPHDHRPRAFSPGPTADVDIVDRRDTGRRLHDPRKGPV